MVIFYRIIPSMKLTKIHKLVASGVISSFLLTASISSLASPLSLIKVEQGSIKTDSSSIWSAMSQQFKLGANSLNNPEVSKQIAILVKNQGTLAKTLQAAAPYISYVFAKTQQKGLPAELALLPIVESQYSPYAKSPVGASGLWQIMPQTATHLGLKRGGGYDGSRDIVASTDAALKYLTDLNKMFKKNWELALAAYNWGPGNILKNVKKQATTNFWALKKIPKETRDYLPKLIALAAVIKNPAKYNIHLPAMSSQVQVASIKVAPKADLKKIALTTGIDVATMRKLNPGYPNLATTHNSPNTVLVPANKVAKLKQLVAVLAVNNFSTDTINKANMIIKTAVQQSVTASLLKQSQWLLVGLANLPSSNAYATTMH